MKLPSREEFEQILVNKKKDELMRRFTSEELIERAEKRYFKDIYYRVIN